MVGPILTGGRAGKSGVGCRAARLAKPVHSKCQSKTPVSPVVYKNAVLQQVPPH